MSSQKTQKLNMHKWTPDDYVQLQEFNDNFDKIDEKVGEHVEKINEVTSQLAQTTKKVRANMSQSEIQTILNENSAIEFLDGDYNINFVNEIGLTIPSNRKIFFRPNAVLKVVPNNLSRYVVLNIDGVSNVEINNLKVVGDRVTHIGTTGERGTSFEIRNSSNIIINNPVISDCWGDGFYINNNNGSNIVIENPVIDNCRRNGISIVAGKDIKINNPVIKNINGIDPQAGIDIEPNLNTDLLDNILINNPITENCVNEGITINPTNINNTGNLVDVTINNHRDRGSKHGFKMIRSVGLKGIVVINNPIYINSVSTGILFRDCDVTSLKTKIVKPQVINCGQYGISVTKELNDTYSTQIGNVEIIEPSVIDDRDIVGTTYSLYIRDMNSGGVVKDVHIINPVKLDGTNKLFFKGSGTISDLNNLLEHKADYTSQVISESSLLITYNNEMLTTPKTYTFKHKLAVGYPELTFKNINSNGLKLQPYTGENIAVVSGVTDQVIQSTQIGASITIKKINDTTWIPIKMIGSWTVV